jgi:hypothetical protein
MQVNRRLLIAVLATLLLVGALAVGLLVTDTPIRAFAQDITDAQEDALEGEDTPITGDALEQASEAALEYARAHGLGEGRVTGAEVGDEEGYYEIEITIGDGRQIDVHLDENFHVLGDEVDRGGADD